MPVECIWIDREVSLAAKKIMVDVLISPCVMYGCELWSVGKQGRKKNLMFTSCGIGEDFCELRVLHEWPLHPCYEKAKPTGSISGITEYIKLWPHNEKNVRGGIWKVVRW